MQQKSAERRFWGLEGVFWGLDGAVKGRLLSAFCRLFVDGGWVERQEAIAAICHCEACPEICPE